MEISQTIRQTTNVTSIWISLPVRAVTPLLIVTSFAIGSEFTGSNAITPVTIESGEVSLPEGTAYTIRSEGSTMTKKMTTDAQNTANGSFNIDPLEYGKLIQKVDGIDEKLDGLITSIKDLPTRDWVQKEMLQTQVDKINKATTIRVAIGGIVVTILIAVIQHFW